MKFKKYNYFSIFACYLLLIKSTVFAVKIIELNKVVCNSNPDFLTFSTCAVNKSPEFPLGAANVAADVKTPLNKVYLYVDIFRIVNGEYKPYFFKFNVEVCSFFSKNRGRDMFSQVLDKISKKFDSNAFKCPLQGNLYGRNMQIEAKDFPAFENLIQLGPFRIVISLYLTEKRVNPIAIAELFFQVTRR